jgi:hypothetical protein
MPLTTAVVHQGLACHRPGAVRPSIPLRGQNRTGLCNALVQTDCGMTDLKTTGFPLSLSRPAWGMIVTLLEWVRVQH